MKIFIIVFLVISCFVISCKRNQNPIEESQINPSQASFKGPEPGIYSYEQVEPGLIKIYLKWKVYWKLNYNYQCFIHFCRYGENTFSHEHMTSTPTMEWLPDSKIVEGPYYVKIPTDVPDADYEILIGLYDVEGNQHRLHLTGINDGQNRFRLGTLRIQNNGLKVSYLTNEYKTDTKK
ncbi:MAG: hypothetical protein JXB49_03925 [Bacteroidales bacterium]|nr:hypothetical protein [Bacteroidales bacterium]